MSSTNSTISIQKDPKNLKEYYEVRPYFQTTVWIHCFYDPSIDMAKAAKSCWQVAERIQTYMNVYAEPEQGNLSWLNRSTEKLIPVQEDIFKVLKHSLEYSRLTLGAFDVTIYPLVQLWKNAAKENKLPSQELLDKVRGRVGYQHIMLHEPNLVAFMKKGMMVDLGSPASGYFCDEAARILDSHQISHFMIDGGGEIFARGMNKGKEPWRVGVQDPFDKAKISIEFELRDKGISTSGSYEKFSTISTEKFSHIIDPRTGCPQKSAASVTVTAPSTQAANELSTALCVMGGKRGIEFVRSLENVEALIVDNDNGQITQYQTDGFGR